MKKILFAFIAVATLSFAFTTLGDVLPIGANIPKADLKLKDISGKEISLKYPSVSIQALEWLRR